MIISSFACEKCGFRNNEVQFAGTFGEKGVHWELSVADGTDLSRSIVKSEYCTVNVPEIDLEMPASPKGSIITTVEGLLVNVEEELSMDQPVRKHTNPELHEQIESFLAKLAALKSGDVPFTLILKDPTGNSYIQNPRAPLKDPKIKLSHFVRTSEQNEQLGLSSEQEESMAGRNTSVSLDMDNAKTMTALSKAVADKNAIHNLSSTDRKGPVGTLIPPHLAAASLDEKSVGEMLFNAREELVELPTQCPSCHTEGTTKMCVTDIPNFKDIVIMAFTCDYCGYRSNEVKPGGGVSALATKITLRAANDADLRRGILKSDTCEVVIPELELEVTTGTLGGFFTTLEGLLEKIQESLNISNDFAFGDSSGEAAISMRQFVEKLVACKEAKMEFTLILDDVLSNSYVEALDGDAEGKIETVQYERSQEQNEDLGLLDMVTENYEA